MPYIRMKYEFGGKGNYVEVRIKANDEKAINDVIQNNRTVWRREKQDKKYMSKYSLDQKKEESGFEPEDEKSDPLSRKIIEEKEKQFTFGLAILSQALDTLTAKQLEVFKLVEVEGYSFRKIGRLKNLSHVTVKEHYDAALKKLRAFYVMLKLKILLKLNVGNMRLNIIKIIMFAKKLKSMLMHLLKLF